MTFMFSWHEQYFTRSLRSLVRYCSCHSNIKVISSRHRVISSIYFLFYLPPLMVTLFPTLMSPYKSLESKFNHCCPNIHHVNYSTIFITLRISPIYMFSLDSKYEIPVNLDLLYTFSHRNKEFRLCLLHQIYYTAKILLTITEKFTFSFLPTTCFYNYDLSVLDYCVF